MNVRRRISAVFPGLLSLSLLLLGGCAGNEFSLPEGDVEAGKTAFVELRCNSCHEVADIQMREDAAVTVVKRLGGERGRVRSYEELVTSVINPSHKISVRTGEDTFVGSTDLTGRSRMQDYNRVMTVQQLIDLVTFLQQEFEISGNNYTYRELQ